MDRQALLKKLKTAVSGKKAKWTLVGLAVVAFAGGIWKWHAKHAAELAQTNAPKGEVAKLEAVHEEAKAASSVDANTDALSDVAPAPVNHTWMQEVADTVANMREKWGSISTALQDNERLKLENARLRLALESTSFDCNALSAENRTQDISRHLSKEAGARVARTLDTIAYRPPTNMLPNQLFTLGVSYFKAREDEKAAVILTFLTGLDDNDAYRTPENYLMTGVAWYHLDNLTVADQYFDKVLTAPVPEKVSPESALEYQAQARLWRAIVAERIGQHKSSQAWLRDLIDHHPHSMEAAWVNSNAKEASRATASDDSE